MVVGFVMLVVRFVVVVAVAVAALNRANSVVVGWSVFSLLFLLGFLAEFSVIPVNAYASESMKTSYFRGYLASTYHHTIARIIWTKFYNNLNVNCSNSITFSRRDLDYNIGGRILLVPR